MFRSRWEMNDVAPVGRHFACGRPTPSATADVCGLWPTTAVTATATAHSAPPSVRPSAVRFRRRASWYICTIGTYLLMCCPSASLSRPRCAGPFQTPLPLPPTNSPTASNDTKKHTQKTHTKNTTLLATPGTSLRPPSCSVFTDCKDDRMRA